jgi:hypothetical protein
LLEKSEEPKISPEIQEIIEKEKRLSEVLRQTHDIVLNQNADGNLIVTGLYDLTDIELFLFFRQENQTLKLQTLDELLERDKQREKDGFPRRRRLGKYIKPVKGNKEKIVVVFTTTTLSPKTKKLPVAAEKEKKVKLLANKNRNHSKAKAKDREQGRVTAPITT